MKWWGEGAYERDTIDGSQTAATTLNEVRENDLIINKIWVRHGSVAIAGPEIHGCAGSNEFPTFTLDHSRVLPRWVHWYTKTRDLWNKCDALSQGTSGKNRIRPERFLTVEIPLPPLPEQRRIVGKVEELAAKIGEARGLRAEIIAKQNALLMAACHRIVQNAPVYPLSEVAPLVRRPVSIRPEGKYAEIGVRSFGKGTFPKPPLLGAELTWHRLYEVRTGDVLLSNIKAWEGAIAVVDSKDNGRVGSHRYLTCVPLDGKATATFVCFYLLSPTGLFAVNEASPGSADRNRTLGMEALQKIPIPTPSYEKQCWFDQIQQSIEDARNLEARSAAELDALLPSILDKAFKGEL